MMATTHALAGLVLGTLVSFVAPTFGPTALLAGLLGGIAPDLDIFAVHRRSLHFPVLLPLLVPVAALPAVLLPTPTTVFLGVFLTAAALHSAMDVFGGGATLRPWLTEGDRAVFSHALGRWLRPRGPITYDGSPLDLLLATAVGVPLVLVISPTYRPLVGALLVVSIGYTLIRKRIVAILGVAVGLVPRRLRPLLPERMREAREEYVTEGPLSGYS